MTAILVLAAIFATGADPEPPKAKAVDPELLKSLQGRWQTTGLESGGKQADPKEVAPLVLEVKDAAFTTYEAGEVKEKAEVALLAAAKEKGGEKFLPAIDVRITAGDDKDKTLSGVWKLDGDVLTICMASPGKPRPTAFETKAGTTNLLFTFKRAKK